MQDEQRQTYQAFFRNNDGKLKGRIAHKTTDHEQFPEMDFGKVDDVADVPALRFTLAENMAFGRTQTTGHASQGRFRS